MEKDEEQKCDTNKPSTSAPVNCQTNSHNDTEEETTKG